jgi:hypothetical protein
MNRLYFFLVALTFSNSALALANNLDEAKEVITCSNSKGFTYSLTGYNNKWEEDAITKSKLNFYIFSDISVIVEMIDPYGGKTYPQTFEEIKYNVISNLGSMIITLTNYNKSTVWVLALQKTDNIRLIDSLIRIGEDPRALPPKAAMFIGECKRIK